VSSEDVTYLVACAAGAVAFVTWITLVLVPAVASYTRLWQRIVAAVLSVYVLAAFLLAGALLGGAVLWYYDSL
jgi:hypothetical protein